MKQFTLLFALVVCALLVSGCGGDSKPADVAETGGAATTPVGGAAPAGNDLAALEAKEAELQKQYDVYQSKLTALGPVDAIKLQISKLEKAAKVPGAPAETQTQLDALKKKLAQWVEAERGRLKFKRELSRLHCEMSKLKREGE